MTPETRSNPPHWGAEFPFLQADFEALAAYSRREFGIDLPNSKKSLVYSRLVRRLRARKTPDFSAYRQLLDQPAESAERDALLSALTTNVTRFFREEHHFDHLREVVLPPLLDHAGRGKKVRLWSAGCSTGQEAFSLAMCVLDQCPNASSLDIRILATDIDPLVIQHAKSAQYTLEETASVPSEFQKYLVEADEKRMPSEELRGLVSFGVLNLVETLPFAGPFQVVFCRNVAIYFDKPTQQNLWNTFDQILEPTGYLFIGHSERISGPAATNLKPAGITTYSKC